MAIDVPNIYTVVHGGPPDDVECYVQETGRGGRDGKQMPTFTLTRETLSQAGTFKKVCVHIVQIAHRVDANF